VIINQSITTVPPPLGWVLGLPWPEAGSAHTLKMVRVQYWRVRCFVQKQIREIRERETGEIIVPGG